MGLARSFGAILVLAVGIGVARAQAPCATSVFAEDFSGGVLPAGWERGPFWSIASATPCATTCQEGFFAFFGSASTANCNCVNFSCSPAGCEGGSFLSSPPIALPQVLQGDRLEVDFCYQGFLDTATLDCHYLRIEHALGWADFKLGPHAFYPCPGWTFLPPFDLTPYAGQVVRLHWLTGTVDCQGYSYMKIDDVRFVYLADPASPDCNQNGTADACDIVGGSSHDFDGNFVPDECQCSHASYCLTSPNSAGAGARIAHSGSTSETLNDTELVVTGVPPGQIGIFFYGGGQAQMPFGQGWLCIGGSIQRLTPPVVASAAGTGALFLDLVGTTPSNEIDAGETWNFQFWYRDPAGGGALFNLSDGLQITFCP
jgi:hypothetical protein